MTPRKRDVLCRVIRAFRGKNFPEDVRRIVDEMAASDGERAICRALAISSLGLRFEEDDGTLSLADHARRALERDAVDSPPLTVLRDACNRCEKGSIRVTDLCQNCTKKPCLAACRFGAIASDGERTAIDQNRCKKCSACIRACPFGAIAKTIMPCESACPVEAISKDASGATTIDFEKCIRCGKCIAACPFEAIQVRSQVIDVLKAIAAGKEVIAMPAPALLGQFSCSAGQLHSAIKRIGFSLVYEVAIGAETTSLNEASELAERLESGEKFMTTSCCAAYNTLVRKHIPDMKPFVSHTGTPLFYTAQMLRKKHPDALLVFLSPCLAKYEEVFANENVGNIINVEELDPLFEALEIIPGDCPDEKFDYATAKEAREFSLTEGVSRAVKSAFVNGKVEVKFVTINGLDRERVKDLKRFAKNGVCDGGNMLEVMSCQGGCVGGGFTRCPLLAATKQVKAYGDGGPSLLENAGKHT